MTTPNNNTPLGIIADAYFDAGLLQEGQSPNSEQFVSGMRRLEDLINLWQTRGLKLWLNQDVPIPLVVGQNLYQMGAGLGIDMTRPLQVIDVYYQAENRVAATALTVGTTYVITEVGTTDFTLCGAVLNAAGVAFVATAAGTGTGTASATNVRRPLTVLARSDYIRLSQTVNKGQVTCYYADKQQTSLNLFLWNTPDATAATGTVHVIIRAQVTNAISLTETMNFPIEWRMALRWGLADELSTGQPQAIMDRCQQRAEATRTALEDWDVEDAPTRFTPDPQMSYYRGSFR